MKRTLLLASVSLIALATFPGIAQAHAAYKDSNPQPDATVSAPPTEVWVEFTERIESGSLSVFDPCGEQVDHGEEEMNLTSDRLTTTTHGDKAGAYRVEWSVLGADGHGTRGEFAFTSTGGDDCQTATEEEPDKEPQTNRDREPNRRTDDTSVSGSSGEGGREVTTKDRVRRERHENHQRNNRTHVKAQRETRDVAQAPEDPTDPTLDKSIWDGIPMGDFLIALGVAALIGAAGGRIYAGIIGPRR